MRARGYGSYRGRPKWKTALKIILIVLILLAALVVGLMYYLQRFLVVSEDGVHLDLPFLQGSSEQETPVPTPPPSIPAEPTDPIEIVTPTPTPTPTVLEPVMLFTGAMFDGTAANAVASVGGNAALFDMKADDGTLAYVSQVELAVSAGVTTDSPGLNMAITAFNEEELYTIARVSCFKDNELPRVRQSLAILTNSGYRWTDPEGVRWSSPTSADVRDYLTALCVELAQLGFDEIMLDHAGYPDRGNLGWIKKGAAYDAAEFSNVVSGFYQQVAQALEPYDVRLSIVTTQAALDGTDELTGQTPENLGSYRLWLRSDDGSYVMVPAS